jgi:protein-S-isoprenylcysteine O-methyltransferase Ste14
MGRRIFAVARAIVIGSLAVSVWVYLVPRWLGGAKAFSDPRPLGWIVIALGATIGLPCVWEFAWRGLGTPAPFDPPRKLVVSGPYRFVRNPMYVGGGLVFIGEAITFPHITVLMLIEAAIAFSAVSIFIILYEEPTLRRMFGADYELYCRNVGRWIPRLRPWYSSPHLD